MMSLSWSFSLVVAWFLCLDAKNGVTSPTGALLTFPFGTPNGTYLQRNMTASPAEFGIHVYGGFKRGYLVIAAEPKYRTQCPAGYNRNSTREPKGINPYVAKLNNYSLENQEPWIMLVDRGDCYFVDKVRYAESLGADAVIVVDNKQEGLVIMWPPESFQQNSVNIPSVFISEYDGQEIYRALGVKGFELNSREPNLKYPNPASYPRITASIEWGLPHPDDRVEWDFWTSSDDKLSPDFFPFGEISKNLTLAGDALFTPHFFILDGRHWGCTGVGLPCGSQCTNGGRYCHQDPERDTSKGITGAQVVQENLRQICVYRFGELYKDYIVWWKYVDMFHQRCYDVQQVSFTESCSYQQMDRLDQLQSRNQGVLQNYVKNCITENGGYGRTSGVNAILANETRIREHTGIYIQPTVSINGFHIYGRLSCPLPIRQNTCQAFQAICAGFLEGTEPAICLARETSCPTYMDCAGVCGGGHTKDACNHCLPFNSTKRDACLDCERVPWGGKKWDCEGRCGGIAVVNRCGICVNKTSNARWKDVGADCHGICGGLDQRDRCGWCGNPRSKSFDACVGCDNIPNSNLTNDCNNVCGGTHERVVCGNGATLCVDKTKHTGKYACEHQASSAGGGKSNNASSIILIVLSVAAILLVLVVLGIMYKNRMDTDARFNELINQYQPLENEPQHGTDTAQQIKVTKTRTLQEDEE